MADKIPVKAKYTGSDTTALAEFESGDTLANSYLNTGTGANQLVQLDGSAKLPAVDGSQLTGIDGLPTQTSHSGKYLTTNGTVASWGTVASGGVNMTSAATAPSSPAVGDQWYDTANGVLYVRVTDGTDAAWLDISSANGTAAASGGGGGAWSLISTATITSSTASADFTSLADGDYIVRGLNVGTGTSGKYLTVRLYTAAGSLETGSTAYHSNRSGFGSGSVNEGSFNSSGLKAYPVLRPATTDDYLDIEVRFSVKLGVTSVFVTQTVSAASSTGFTHLAGKLATNSSTSKITGIQVIADDYSSNMGKGEFKLFKIT